VGQLEEPNMSNGSNTRLIAIIFIVIIIVAGGAIAAWWFLIPKEAPPNPDDVAIVFATGRLGDKSFNDGCYLGAVQAQNDFGISFTYVEPDEIAQYEPFLRQYAAHLPFADPYDVIIGIGYDQAEGMMNVAADYPDQAFAIVDMFIDPGTYPNVSSLLFAAGEGSALVGALAGTVTGEDKIGFVGGMDVPLIREFAAGYFWGANFSNPTFALDNETGSPDFVHTYVNDFGNPTLGESLADGIYAGGADIIFSAAGKSGLGVLDSAVKTNGTLAYPVWAIGVDMPQMFLGTADPDNPVAPSVIFTSMLKRVDLGVYQVIEAASDIGTPLTGLQFYGLFNDGVGWEDNETLLGWAWPQATRDMIADLTQGIINGTYIIPVDFDWLA
jgi:basic membrane protein A